MASPDRLPWGASPRFNDPLTVHAAALKLDDDASGQWTFAVFVARLRVMEPNGFDVAYEHLRSFEEVVSVEQLRAGLEAAGVRRELNYSTTVGFHVFDTALRSTTGLLRMPHHGEAYRGRHSVPVAGIESSQNVVIFQNSWGENWGDAGFGYLSEEYFNNEVDDIILWRPSWMGPSPRMFKRMRELQFWLGGEALDHWLDAWDRGGDGGFLTQVHGHQCAIRLLYAFNGDPYEVIEMRDQGNLWCRAHIRHDRTVSQTIVEELWVPPNFRRGGVGTAVLALAEERARAVDSRSVILQVGEADSGSVGAGRARAFAKSQGYRWRRATGRVRPVVHAFARKKV